MLQGLNNIIGGYSKIHPKKDKEKYEPQQENIEGSTTAALLNPNGILKLEIQRSNFEYDDEMNIFKYFSKYIGYGLSESELNFRISEALNKKRHQEHYDHHLIFHRVITKDYDIVKVALKLNKDHLNLTDAVGANLVHLVYLHGHYDFGHYLIENYPAQCVQRYSSRSTINGIKKEHMPFTGETILHMAIIDRNYNEVRWILDFYKQRKHALIGKSKLNGLQYLLRSRAVGKFFSINNKEFYVGETPLHFAASSNDTHIFDLVLSYCSIETPDALFTRDSHGNSVLHLCVIRGHQKMFSHIIKTVKSFIAKKLRNAASAQEVLINKAEGVSREDYFMLNMFDELHKSKVNVKTDNGAALSIMKKAWSGVREAVARGVDGKGHEDEEDEEEGGVTGLPECGHSPRQTAIQLPRTNSPAVLDAWVEELTEVKFAEHMSEVLNNDGHSLLTLAASEEKPDMLAFLIGELKKEQLHFGPQQFHHIDLDGFEQPHVRVDYKPPIPASKPLHSAIEWLCIVSGQRPADSIDPPVGFNIKAVEQLVETKWERVGKPVFVRRWYLSLVIAALITIITCMPDQDPSFAPDNGDVGISVLYIVTALCLVILFAGEVPYLFNYPQLRGAARLEKMCGLVTALSFSSMCLCKVMNYYNNGSYYIFDDQNFTYPRMDNQGIEISLSVCAISAWLSIYYFLMGFNSTGPFILKIYTIISKDVPYFLQYYVIILMALSCALSMLTDDGNPATGAGYYRLLLMFWTLFKVTVGGSDDYGVANLYSVPQDLQWFFDVVFTLFRVAAVLLMINLLIAIIGNTFNAYSEVALEILLMEKYNIMCAQELCGPASSKERNLSTYAVKTIVKKLYEEDLLAKDKTDDRYDNEIWYFKLEEIDLSWWECAEEDHDHQGGAEKSFKTVVFIMDAQNSFHPGNQHRPGGSLTVRGANEDSYRIAKMIRENVRGIDEIFVSMDTHNRYDIGHALFWKDSAKGGGPPDPFTVFTHEEISSGRLVPANDPHGILLKRCLQYAKNLAAKGNFKLVIWPEHCVIGSQGHAIVKEINDALQEWTLHHKKEVNYVIKGRNPWTEMYSCLRAEVEDPADPGTALNTELLGQLKIADKLLICGEALSHTVNYTCRDLVKYIDASKLYLLRDGTSPVEGFERDAEEFVDWFATQGCHVVTIGDMFSNQLSGGDAALNKAAAGFHRGISRSASQVMTAGALAAVPPERVRRPSVASLRVSDAAASAAYTVLCDPANCISSASLQEKLEHLGVREAGDLKHLSSHSLILVAKFLKEAPESKFLSYFGITMEEN